MLPRFPPLLRSCELTGAYEDERDGERKEEVPREGSLAPRRIGSRKIIMISIGVIVSGHQRVAILGWSHLPPSMSRLKSDISTSGFLPAFLPIAAVWRLSRTHARARGNASSARRCALCDRRAAAAYFVWNPKRHEPYAR